MLEFRFRSGLMAAGLTVLLLAPAAQAQTREVVSKAVSVGRSEASLVLEFDDDGRLEISLDDGVVLVDGEAVGAFEPGGTLDVEWRELLGQAVSLDDGPLAEALTDWTVPAELAGELADIAQEIDRALEDALTGPSVQIDADEGEVSISIGGEEGSLVRALLAVGRLGFLEDAFEGLDQDMRIHVQEDVEVGPDEVVQGNLVAIEGDVRIAGQVEGDVVVVGGSLELLEGSLVSGEVRIADARLVRNQGTVEGSVVDVLEDEREFETELRDRLRTEVRDELRRELRSELRNVTRFDFDDHDEFSIMAPFVSVARGVGGLLENLMGILVLGLIGAGLLLFAGDNMQTIAQTAREAPGRSAMVGFAGTFLLIPVWILGAVALIVSIIGIPVAVAWLPLFPMAACLAALVGYLAVAQNAGEWLAASEYPWTGWIRQSNPIFTMVGGLLGLMLAFMAANVIGILPFLGFLKGLLVFLGMALTFLAIQIGFGAVLLTRAGRRREQWSSYDADKAWEAAMDVEVEVEQDEPSDAAGSVEEAGSEGEQDA